MTPSPHHLDAAFTTSLTARRTTASTRRRACLQDVFDLCIVGAGPTAAMLALSANERGLSVAFLDEGTRTPTIGPRHGVIGHRHPYGYRWLARRHGSRAALRFAAAAQAGRERFEHLVSTYAIPCELDTVPCHLGTLEDDPRLLRQELDALVDAGLPVRAAPEAGAPAPFSVARYRLPDERVVDEEAFVRGIADVAAAHGVVVDGAPVEPLHRLPGFRGSWSVRTERARYVSRHVVQTQPAMSDHPGFRPRTVGANILLIDTADVVPEGRYHFHARQPVEAVVREDRSLGYRRLVVSRFGGRCAVDDGFEAWATRSWTDGLVRDRWWVETPIRGGSPVYGQLGRSRRWLLGGLGLWGLSVQSHVAGRVVAAVDTDLRGSRAIGRLTWPRTAPVVAGRAPG